jgi:RNA 2',3'-cyclic 3'-phosphodiesterase
MRRLFVGLMADTSVQRRLLRHQNTWRWPPGVRLTPAAKFHLTLQFLGQMEAPAEDQLVAELSRIEFQPFELVLETAGSFHGCIAWLAPQRSAEISNLHQAVTSAARAAGIEANEEWTPHVTMARKADGAEPPSSVAPISWAVSAFSLVWSNDKGYEEIARWQRTGPVLPLQ